MGKKLSSLLKLLETLHLHIASVLLSIRKVSVNVTILSDGNEEGYRLFCSSSGNLDRLSPIE
jgi:hypothetical protein